MSPRGAALAGVLVAAAWVGLAVWRPTTTWHAGPFLVAAFPVWLLGTQVTPRAVLVRAGVAGAAGSLAVGAVLAVTGRLQGPTVLDRGPAVVEVVLLALLGAAVATGLALRRAARRA